MEKLDCEICNAKKPQNETVDTLHRAACSIHLWWNPVVTAERFYLECRIEQTAKGSYFMICGWNTGYFGIQELGDGKKIALFSVWDPTQGDNPDLVKKEDRVEVLYSGQDVQISRFGNEGTGGKSVTPFNWQIGETIRCLVSTTIYGSKTAYAGWLWQPNEKKWKHLATFRVHTGGKPLSGLYSFIEDFRRDFKSTTEVRRAVYGNGWIKTPEGKVVCLNKATFTCSNDSSEAKTFINAGEAEGGFYLQNGGSTVNTTKLHSILEMRKPSSESPSDFPLAL